MKLILKFVFVGVGWCWGLVVAVTWFEPRVGMFGTRTGKVSAVQKNSRGIAALFLTAYFLAPLLVFPLG